MSQKAPPGGGSGARALNVLVVDDSAFVRKALRRILSATADIKVVREAATGKEALDALHETRIDVVTLDVQLPDMSGLLVLEKLREFRPDLPVLMLSACTQRGTAVTLEALTLGAADFIDKTRFGTLDLAGLGNEVAEKVRAISRGAACTRPPPAALESARPLTLPELDLRAIGLCVIGASTGGPAAVQSVLQAARKNLSFPVVIAQHMPKAFTRAFAQRLDTLCELSVSELGHGQALLPGHAYVVPGGKHAHVLSGLVAELYEDPAVGVHVPSVDELFTSAAQCCSRPVLGMLLTGMGRDGARGLNVIRNAGGVTVGQDEATSVVYGMPRAAKEAGAVMHELALDELSRLLA
jgi:two-component system chemotaxis response regulator CheB